LQCNSAEIPDPLQEVKYTLDLTKPYNDLLSIGGQRFVWGNELVASEGSDNNEQFSYLSDHLGSPIRLVGDNQAETLSYDEFGVPLVDANTSISTNASKHPDNTNNFHNPFGFTGYQSDNVSELYYAQARYYVPSVGRFGATDVIKGYTVWSATLNEYAYCINSPNIYVDLDGEFLTLITGAVGAIAGASVGAITSYVTTGEVSWKAVAAGAAIGGVIGLTGGAAIMIAAKKVTAVAAIKPAVTKVAAGALKGQVVGGFASATSQYITTGSIAPQNLAIDVLASGFMGGIGGASALGRVTDFQLLAAGGTASAASYSVTESVNNTWSEKTPIAHASQMSLRFASGMFFAGAGELWKPTSGRWINSGVAVMWSVGEAITDGVNELLTRSLFQTNKCMR
jgi:RHS repeat-associated protein